MEAGVMKNGFLFGFLLVIIPCTRAIPIDKAELVIQSSVDFNISVYGQYGNESCWQCPEQLLGVVDQQDNKTLLIDSRWAILITLYQNDNRSMPLCVKNNITMKRYTEHSSTNIYINPSMDESSYCNIPATDKTGEILDGLLPIVVALLGFFVLACLWIFLKYCYRNNIMYRILFCMETDRLVNSDLGIPSRRDDDEVRRSDRRLKSLDAFRGLSLVVMIFVNYGGGRYWFFAHATWNGLTIADLVFPWFIFIMGTAMTLSFSALQRKNVPRRQLLWKIVSRTLILFILGVMISNGDGNNDITKLRIPGVLQRFAATYFVVAMMELCFAHGAVDQYQYKWWASIRDIMIFWHEWLIALSLVAVWVCLTFLLRVDDGCPVGYLGPGGIHMNGAHWNCTGGAAGYIDRWVLGNDHLYQRPTCKKMYNTFMPYDPEGILGTLTSIFLCFLGLQAGKVLLIFKDWKQRTVRWLIWGIVLGLISGVLCNFSQNDGVIPVNKNLWSLSYVTTMASFAFFLLTVFYVTIDVYKIWSGAPFFYPGMNPIIIYCGSEVLQRYFPITFTYPQMDSHAAYLALDIWGTSFWVLVAVYMHYKQIFFSV